MYYVIRTSGEEVNITKHETKEELKVILVEIAKNANNGIDFTEDWEINSQDTDILDKWSYEQILIVEGKCIVPESIVGQEVTEVIKTTWDFKIK